jgi:hypothetical protein
MTAKAFTERRELAHRAADGIEVTLFWSTPGDRITIVVMDTRSEETLEFEVDGSAALNAFNHPYAYAARHAHDSVRRLDADALTASTDR